MPTYYVRAVGGSNANDGLSFANGWATIQYAENQVVAGDRVIICADAPHDQTVSIEMRANAGTAAAPIDFAGGNATGIEDGTRPIVRATAAIAAGVFVFYQDGDYLSLSRIEIDGNSLAVNCVSHELNQPSNDITFLSCELYGATGDGMIGRFQYSRFYDCEIRDNGGRGFVQTEPDTDNAWDYCVISDNGGDGVVLEGAAGQVRNCLIYGNDGHGILLNDTVESDVIEQNTIYNNTGDGISGTGTATGHRGHSLFSNSLVDNGGYGYNTGGLYEFALAGYNHTDGNTLGPTDLPEMPGIFNVTGPPYFKSTTPGAEDFSPVGPVSPLWDGVSGTIGASAHQLTFLNIGGVQTRKRGKVGKDAIR